MHEKPDLPRLFVPKRDLSLPLGDPEATAWERAACIRSFVRAEDGGAVRQPTEARLLHDGRALCVRFDCRDCDVWGTYRGRDEPLHEEEAVEVFVAPGAAAPARYFEFQINPLGALFDARVDNPHSRRADMTVGVDWDCPGIAWRAGIEPAAERWWAMLVLPFAALAPAGERPAVWRANLYRIERPRGGQAEFSCWSPTLRTPPDFHQPGRFGTLELEL